jgi:hypothetical protein
VDWLTAGGVVGAGGWVLLLVLSPLLVLGVVALLFLFAVLFTMEDPQARRRSDDDNWRY